MAKKTPFPPRDAISALIHNGSLTVRVTPNAAENSISLPAEAGAALLVRVTATPEDGKANAAVLKLLAKALGLPKTSLAIVRGSNARTKVISVRD